MHDDYPRSLLSLAIVFKDESKNNLKSLWNSVRIRTGAFDQKKGAGHSSSAEGTEGVREKLDTAITECNMPARQQDSVSLLLMARHAQD